MVLESGRPFEDTRLPDVFDIKSQTSNVKFQKEDIQQTQRGRNFFPPLCVSNKNQYSCWTASSKQSKISSRHFLQSRNIAFGVM